MIEHKDMPAEWTRNGDGWLGPGASALGAQAGLRGERCITWARVYGVDRATRQEAEQDLLRMVWSLQDGYDPRALRIEIERLRASLATAERDRDYNHAMWVEARNERADLLRRVEALRRTVADQQQVIDHLLRPVAARVLRRITGLVRR